MKQLLRFKLFSILIMFFAFVNFCVSVVHIELKKSTAKYHSDYLKSLKFLQKNIINPVSSFLEEKDISLHQQV
jgi:hypothetical protein